MTGKFRRIQRLLKVYIRFKDVSKAIKFVSGVSIAGLRKEIKSRFEAACSIMPLFNNKYLIDEYDTAITLCITEDRGRCGPHNNNIIDFTRGSLGFLEEHNINNKLYCIGKIGYYLLKKKYLNLFLGGLMDYKDIKFNIDLSYMLLRKITNIKKINYDRIFIVFNRYISIQIQKVLVYEIGSFEGYLNILYSRSNEVNKLSTFFNLFLSKSSEFLLNLYNFGLSLLLSDALMDNKYSFLAGRFLATENAIKNIEELIEGLTIVYNKIRQEVITTELTEIITCKEALS